MEELIQWSSVGVEARTAFPQSVHQLLLTAKGEKKEDPYFLLKLFFLRFFRP